MSGKAGIGEVLKAQLRVAVTDRVWLRAGIVVLALTASVLLCLWKNGAAVGSFSANLMAKASLIARTAPEVDAQFFSGLSARESDAREYAQVWDERGVVVYRSASLGREDLPTTAPANRRLLDLPGRGYGIRIEVPIANGGTRTSLYAVGESPLGDDLQTSGVITAVFLVLPSVLVALFLPARRGPTMPPA